MPTPLPGSTGPFANQSGPPQGQIPTNMDLWQYYQDAMRQSQGDYSNLMDQYNRFDPYQPTAPEQINPSLINGGSLNLQPSGMGMDYSQVTGGGPFQGYNPSLVGSAPDPSSLADWRNMADTGGYSEADLGNIRERGISPIRSAYASAGRNVDRQRGLQGGYSPGYNALQSRLAREQGQAMSDASTNVEGMIAPMVQQGRAEGLRGLSSTEQAGIDRNVNIDALNAAASDRANQFNQQMQNQMDQLNRDRMMQIMSMNQQMQQDVDLANFNRQGQIASANQASTNQANQANADAQARFNQQMADAQQQRLAALGGMSNVYSASPGQQRTTGGQVFDALDMGQRLFANRGGRTESRSGSGGISIGGGGGNQAPLPTPSPTNPYAGSSSAAPAGHSLDFRPTNAPRPGHSY